MDSSAILDLLYSKCVEAGVDEVSAIVSEEKAHLVRFSENQISISETWDTIRAIAYLFQDKRRASFLLEDLSPPRIEDAVKITLQWMKRSEKPKVEVSLPDGPFEYGMVDCSYDPRIPTMDREPPDLIDAAVNGALSEKAKKSSGVLRSQESTRLIKTSKGCEGSEKGTYLEFTIRALYDEDSSGHENWCGSTIDGFNPEDLGKRAGRMAYQARNPSEGKPGIYNVIFSPSVMGDLLNSVALSSSASMVEVGLSCLGDKVGKKIASEDFTLVDDARVPSSPGITLFDDEGHPTERVEIIKNGVFQTFLHSSYTAARGGGKLTGNAYYSLFGEVSPIPRCLLVDPGTLGEGEMVEECRDGLYVTNTWYTRFQNYISGDFSTIPRDALFKVEHGELVSPVKALRISDNLLRILNAIKTFSKDRVWRRGWEIEIPILLPSFLVEEVRMTQSTK